MNAVYVSFHLRHCHLPLRFASHRGGFLRPADSSGGPNHLLAIRKLSLVVRTLACPCALIPQIFLEHFRCVSSFVVIQSRQSFRRFAYLENLLITSVFWMILFVTLLVRRFVWQAKMADKIDIRWGKAQDAIPQLNSGSLFSKPVDGIDFLFLDAKPSEYLDYLLAAEPLLNPGAVIVADNAGIFSKSLTEYLNYVRGSGRYESEYIESTLEYRDEVPDGLEVSRYVVQS